MSTALASYLTRTGLSDAGFGERIGRDRTMVSKLRRGLLTPTLELAAAIERETEGEVPMATWLPDSPPPFPAPLPGTDLPASSPARSAATAPTHISNTGRPGTSGSSTSSRSEAPAEAQAEAA